MQTSSLDYQYSNNTIILFASQNIIIIILLFIGVLQCLAVLRAFCQWKIEHQIKKCCAKGLILRNMAERERDAGLYESGYKQ